MRQNRRDDLISFALEHEALTTRERAAIYSGEGGVLCLGHGHTQSDSDQPYSALEHRPLAPASTALIDQGPTMHQHSDRTTRYGHTKKVVESSQASQDEVVRISFL
jgi:hypothetical protein